MRAKMAERRQLVWLMVWLITALFGSARSTVCTTLSGLISFDSTALNGTALPTSVSLNCSAIGDSETPRQNLTLLVLAPYGPIEEVRWPGGPWLFPATRLAMKHINSNRCLLPGYNLELIEEDSGCASWLKTLVSYNKHVPYSERNVIGVVGPACSTGLTAINTMNFPTRAPVVQVTIATTPLLDNAALFPYTFSTLGSGGQLMQAFVEVIRENCWKKIAVVQLSDSNYHARIANTLIGLLKARNLSVDVEKFPMTSTFSPLEGIVMSKTRVILFLLPPTRFCQFICSAYEHTPKVIFPAYQFVVSERSEQEIEQCGLCNQTAKTEALQNAIFILNSLATSSESKTVSGFTLSEFRQEYNRSVEEFMQTSDHSYEFEAGRDYATVYYDSVWSLALCLDIISKNSNVQLSEFRAGLMNTAIPDKIRECLFQLSFEGVSGTINFDHETRQALTSVITYQFTNGSLHALTYFNGTEFMKMKNGTFISDHFDSKFVIMSPFFAAYLFIMTCFLLLLTVFFHVLNIVYSKHKAIKASSPKLFHFIFIGSYVIMIAISTYTVPAVFEITNETLGRVLCNINALADVGVTLIFVTVLVRMFRLYRIFIHYMRPGGEMLKDRILILFIILLTLPTVIILIIALSVEPYTWKTMTSFNSISDMPFIESLYICATDNHDGAPHNIALLIYYWILLMICLWLSFVTKDINKQYRTTSSTNALIYILVLVFGLALAVSIIDLVGEIFEDKRVSFGIKFVMFHGVLLACALFLYLPPVIPLLKEKWQKVSDSSELKGKLSFANETKVVALTRVPVCESKDMLS